MTLGKKREHLLWALLAWLGCSAMLALWDAPKALGALDLNSLIRRYNSIQQKRAALLRNLRAAKQQQEQARGQLRSTEQQVREAMADLAEARSQLAKARREEQNAQKELENATRLFTTHKAALEQRVVDLFLQGQASYLEVVLAATDFSDFANRAYLAEKLVERDRILFYRLKSKREKWQEAKEKWEARRIEATSLERTARQEQERLRVLQEQRLKRLKTANVQRQQLEEEWAEMEAASREAEALIRRLMREQGALLTGGRGPGGLSWPVSGTITSGYGWRRPPRRGASAFHRGIDISAPYGTPIRAAANGTVIFSGWMRGYGNTVMIAHGGNVVTLYAHCSSLLVSEGNRVFRGQVIARVGSTGVATGNHLHFEKRVGGTAVPPL